MKDLLLLRLRQSIITLCALFIGSSAVDLQAQDLCRADTSFTDILFLIDNSGSINDDEFELFSDLIMGTINDVKAKCLSSQLGVVHYGGAFGLETVVEFPFSRTTNIPDVERQFCTARNQFGNCSEGGGDDLNNAIGDIISFIQDGSINRNPTNKLALVIFTDAFGFDENCGFINCSVIRPFTNIDILKSQFNAQVTVVGVSEQAEATLLGLYASPGGSFDNVNLFQQDCPSTFDGCVVPRKYIPLEFDSPVGPSSDSIAVCVDCTIEIIGGFSVDAGLNQTICEEEDGTITLTAQTFNGTAPFSFSWDQGVGIGNNIQVAPQITTTYTVTATDANGCIATDVMTITVDNCFPDCPAPTLICPPDILGCPGGSVDTSETGTAVAIFDTSICDLVNISYQDVQLPNDCPSANVIRRIWRAEIAGDPSLFDTCVQLISYLDMTPPVFLNCPPDVILDPDSTFYMWEDPLVIDECGFTLSYSIPNGSTFPTGLTTVTAYATDVCGNIDSCSFIVTVPKEVELICESVSQRCVDTLTSNNIPLPDVISECPLCADNPTNCVSISTTIDDIRVEGETIVYDITYVATDLCGTDDICSTSIILDNSSFVDCPDDIIIEAPPFGFTDVMWTKPSYISCCSLCKVRQIPGFLYMGQLGDSYYYCSYARVNWRKAKRGAEEIGGHLVAINSQAENDFISRRLIEREAYIGLNDQAQEGDYRWVNGESLTYTKWKPSQPNGTEDEDVVEMDAQGYWYDVTGKEKREYVVEIQGCDQVTQIGGPEPGSKFRVGSTTITYEGEDGCGNKDVCSFEVILLPFSGADGETAFTRSESPDFTFAPNPTNSYIELNSTIGLSRVQVFNTQGQVLKSWYFTGATQKRIDISDLPHGVQLMRVSFLDGSEKTEKIIIVE